MNEALIKTEPVTTLEAQPITDDFLEAVATRAEKRIDAVVKIKQTALKVTNADDWCDQKGQPYMMASAAEKIANLFGICWRIDEPRYEEEPDGHFTYIFKGTFTLAGRSIDAEGSRSSKDPFFIQYQYKEGSPRKEKPVQERDNKRDVRMAALTNLLGNGITRILGMRNLSYSDLEAFAGIKKADVTEVVYKDHSPLKKPAEKPAEQPAAAETAESKPESQDSFGPNMFRAGDKGQQIKLGTVKTQTGENERGEWIRYYAKGSDGHWYQTFSSTVGEQMEKLSGQLVDLIYKLEKTEKGESRSIVSIAALE